MIAYMVGSLIAVIWIFLVVLFVAMCVLAHRADEQAARLLAQPESVADGYDWTAAAREGLERHRARRRGVTHV